MDLPTFVDRSGNDVSFPAGPTYGLSVTLVGRCRMGVPGFPGGDFGT